MKKIIFLLLLLSLFGNSFAQTAGDYPVKKEKEEINELKFIGYYFVRSELSNMYANNEFLKGQVVGRLFGGNTTKTGLTSKYTEQRFIPIFAYTPKLFDGWATLRASFEFDWTWGDANYGAGGNFGGAFGADFVNMQTQNLFVEIRPQKNFFVNIGLARVFDNINVPSYTPTDKLVNTGYRLAVWGSDGVGISAHYILPNMKMKAGFYQLYENNVQDDDDVVLYELDYEYDFDIKTSAGLTVYYLSDRANGEGGVSIMGQGLNCALSNYNGVFNFDFGTEAYTADIFWLGTHFHHDPLLKQGRFGYSGFAMTNLGTAETKSTTVDIAGLAANLRLAYKYGKNPNDHIVLDAVFTSGDKKNIADGKYNGFLTGNNWTAPGAVFFGHGLYLLLPHGNVVNRFMSAVIDIQNLGYGLSAGSLYGSYDIIPHKLKAKIGTGVGMANVSPAGGGSMIGTEFNFNLRYTLRVYMDIELHGAYLNLGDFYDSSVVNGGGLKPENPWLLFASFKWIMF